MSKTITLEHINPNVKKMEYDVASSLATRARLLERELKEGIRKPFTEVIRADVGDCQAMGQQPLTFVRQVLALCLYPTLMDGSSFPEDVKERAAEILKHFKGGSIGAYSEAKGTELVRKHVAEFIEQRDGVPTSHLNIILSTGSTEIIRKVLSLLNFSNENQRTGVMVPVPQHQLYSAALVEFGMHQISYYLDEEDSWALNIKELKRAIEEAKTNCQPRALVVINPGNPTGSVLRRENIEEVIKFAYSEKLIILADEVYQENIYSKDVPFHSVKKVMTEMGYPYKSMVLISFMSASKGYMAECGPRGGCCELVNVEPVIIDMLFKPMANNSSSCVGQVAMDCVVKPPQVGQPSWECFIKEKMALQDSYIERSALVMETLNSLQGVKCNEILGGIYAFPKISIPEKAIEKAKSLGQTPDFFYAMQLLENTGICIVPGCQFGQIDGTYHIRVMIFLEMDKLQWLLRRLEHFHKIFCDKYK